MWQSAAAQNPTAVLPRNAKTPTLADWSLARSCKWSAPPHEPWLAAASPSARCSAPLYPMVQHQAQRRLARGRAPCGTLHVGDQPTTSRRDPPAMQMDPMLSGPWCRDLRSKAHNSDSSRLGDKCLATTDHHIAWCNKTMTVAGGALTQNNYGSDSDCNVSKHPTPLSNVKPWNAGGTGSCNIFR